ncbi:acylase [Corallococcus carmarthensis]|uniref:Acylase n=1 Tax=Corallococcus carmarthensis TaxID=2316728 RepID=A0A3A8JIT1_9BACT|nr:acylase [Corallococcus carmarthensis]NOK21346.1 acylase [Corallococcus carmarthensis]RKG95629.1 acylase [Corallococcus carmarthensis]
MVGRNGRNGGARVLPLVALMCATACEPRAATPPAPEGPTASVKLSVGSLSATVRRTAHGIPHVLADDFAGVGYGYGYAFAQDNFCELMDALVTVNAERSRYFGPDGTYLAALGSRYNNLKSDFFYQAIVDDGTVDTLLAKPPPLGPSQDVRELVRGYTAGINRYLAETGVDALPDARCRGGAWVRPITEHDLYLRYYQLSLFASSLFFLDALVDAKPPSLLPDGTLPQPLAVPASLDRNVFPHSESLGLGSNAFGLGSQATRNGKGMLLANPHFPWEGSERFYEAHLTVPGKLNVSGVSLLGVPAILIGHNETLAWSHTVSTAYRFTPFELKLIPGAPTKYLYDGQIRQMTTRTVTVQAKEADGSLTPRQHTFYRSHLGPMLEYPSGLMTWNGLTGYAFHDANASNLRILDAFFSMDRAANVDELRTAQATWQGIPWVNTIATDAQGHAYYADMSVVPHVTDAKLLRCVLSPIPLLVLASAGLPVLDGSRSDCALGSDADAVEPGIFGPGSLPHLSRADFVTNSNDSYWLPNPAQPLTGFPRILGGEKNVRSLRTRLGLKMVQGRLAGTDGLEGQGFTLEQLQTVTFNNRNFSGELLRDAAVALCRRTPYVLMPDLTFEDLRPACPVLAAWDLKGDLDSRGELLWRVFIFNVAGITGGPYLVPFNANDPVNTPRTLNTLNPQVAQGLGTAIRTLRTRGIALDATTGSVQGKRKNGIFYPVHGCSHEEGCFNQIANQLLPDNTYEPALGSSFVMAVSFTDAGPVAKSVLTYSQSTNPASPWYADQTAMFSQKQWVDRRYTEAEIAGDPALTVTHLQE